jgi:hypothetical protein
MKRSLLSAFALLAGAAIVLSSCASTGKAPVAAPVASTAPAVAPEPVPAPKVAKQRTLIVKAPILVKESSFYPDGLLDEYVVYKYDDTKTRLLEKSTFDAARPDPTEREVSEWKDGKLAAETVFDADGKIKLRREYAYTAAGKLASERVLDAKGKLQSSSTYAYDAAGAKTEWRAFDGEGLLKAVTSYAPTRIEMKNSGGALTGSISIETGPGGVPLAYTYFAADGTKQKIEIYFYATGSAVPAAIETRRADGTVTSKTSYAYGSLGELVKSVTVDGSGGVRDTRSYDYAIREDSRIETYYE